MGRCGLGVGAGITGFSLSDTSVLLLARCFLRMAGCSRRFLFWIQGCVAHLVSHAACSLSAAGRGRSRRDTLGTSAPVDHLGFVDLVTRGVGGLKAGVVHRT